MYEYKVANIDSLYGFLVMYKPKHEIIGMS